MQDGRHFGFVLAASALAFGSTATAAEFCVACSNPDANYRCVIEGTGEGSSSDPRAQMRCISLLAQGGGHETCTVKRNAAPPCPGEIRVFAANGASSAPADAAPAPLPTPTSPEPVAPGVAQPEASPADEAPAGAVGKAAKKTWDCLKSLFSDC